MPVGADLSLPDHPEVFVIGDLAAARAGTASRYHSWPRWRSRAAGTPPATSSRRLAGKPTRPLPLSQPRHHGDHRTAVGGGRAAGRDRFQGTLGWLAWLGVHLVFLVGFRNRAVVLVNWAWNYLTWDRASRVILDDGSRTPPGHLRLSRLGGSTSRSADPGGNSVNRRSRVFSDGVFAIAITLLALTIAQPTTATTGTCPHVGHRPSPAANV